MGSGMRFAVVWILSSLFSALDKKLVILTFFVSGALTLV